MRRRIADLISSALTAHGATFATGCSARSQDDKDADLGRYRMEIHAEQLGYDKRTMAKDLAALMDHLGHKRAPVVGRDRGARKRT